MAQSSNKPKRRMIDRSLPEGSPSYILSCHKGDVYIYEADLPQYNRIRQRVWQLKKAKGENSSTKSKKGSVSGCLKFLMDESGKSEAQKKIDQEILEKVVTSEYDYQLRYGLGPHDNNSSLKESTTIKGVVPSGNNLYAAVYDIDHQPVYIPIVPGYPILNPSNTLHSDTLLRIAETLKSQEEMIVPIDVPEFTCNLIPISHSTIPTEDTNSTNQISQDKENRQVEKMSAEKLSTKSSLVSSNTSMQSLSFSPSDFLQDTSGNKPVKQESNSTNFDSNILRTPDTLELLSGQALPTPIVNRSFSNKQCHTMFDITNTLDTPKILDCAVTEENKEAHDSQSSTSSLGIEPLQLNADIGMVNYSLITDKKRLINTKSNESSTITPEILGALPMHDEKVPDVT